MRRWLGLSLVMLILLAALAAPAAAQTAPAPRSSSGRATGIGWRGWGAQVGLSSSPDQIYGGVHFELGEFAKDVRFRPSAEIGVGDDRTLLQGLAEVHYLFPKSRVWKPYVGGGAGLTYVNFDSGARRRHDTETEIALMGIGGVETRLKSATRFYLEGKVGLGDEDPDLKVAAGWSWK